MEFWPRKARGVHSTLNGAVLNTDLLIVVHFGDFRDEWTTTCQ